MSAAEELKFATQFLHQIASRPIRHPLSYEPPLQSLTRALPHASRPFPLRDPSSAPAPQLTITIKPLKGGQSFTLPVSRLEPIDDLKLRVAAKSGVPASHQRLVFGGKALLEGKTLLDFGIGDGATVHLLKKAGAEKAEVSAAAPVPAEKVKEAKPAAGATKEDGFVSVVKEKGNDPAFWADLRSTLQSHFGADSQHVDKVYEHLLQSYQIICGPLTPAERTSLRNAAHH